MPIGDFTNYVAEQLARNASGSPESSADAMIGAALNGQTPNQFMADKMQKSVLQTAATLAFNPEMSQHILDAVSPGTKAVTAQDVLPNLQGTVPGTGMSPMQAMMPGMVGQAPGLWGMGQLNQLGQPNMAGTPQMATTGATMPGTEGAPNTANQTPGPNVNGGYYNPYDPASMAAYGQMVTDQYGKNMQMLGGHLDNSSNLQKYRDDIDAVSNQLNTPRPEMPNIPQRVLPQDPSTMQTVIAGLGALAGGAYGGGLEAATQPFVANTQRAGQVNEQNLQNYALQFQQYQAGQQAYEQRVQDLMHKAGMDEDMAKLVATMEQQRSGQALQLAHMTAQGAQQQAKYKADLDKQAKRLARTGLDNLQRTVNQQFRTAGFMSDAQKIAFQNEADRISAQYGQEPEDLVFPDGQSVGLQAMHQRAAQFQQVQQRLGDQFAKTYQNQLDRLDIAKQRIELARENGDQNSYRNAIMAYNAQVKAAQLGYESQKGINKQSSVLGQALAKANGLDAQATKAEADAKASNSDKDLANARALREKAAGAMETYNTLKSQLSQIQPISLPDMPQPVQQQQQSGQPGQPMQKQASKPISPGMGKTRSGINYSLQINN